MNVKKCDLEKNEAVIKNCVSKWEEEMDDSVYNECCKIINRNQIGKDISFETIRRFLYVWGSMGRVLGRTQYKNWEKGLELAIKTNCTQLIRFRNMYLLQSDLVEYQQDIKKCYKSFCAVLGPIAAVKTLHLFCSNFFPLAYYGRSSLSEQ